jgi:septal ring factor EnvC (AmiA/AmiB activator)
MNAKTTAILLTIVSLLLGGALWYRHSTAIETEEKHLATINQLSNEWKQTSADLKDQRAVNLTLERDLANRGEELKAVNNNLAATTANLAKTQADAKAALEAAEAAMKARDEKIKGLEGERDDLTKQMTVLNGSIGKLEGMISETERKLKASEGDREYLIKELKRLQAEKAELERRFQDLAVLREQVRKMRDELSVARRLDWIRRGVYGDVGKGAERLQRGFTPAAAEATNPPAGKTGQFGLDVEIRRDGGVKINTNTPAGKPAPAATNPPTPAPAKPAAK